MAAADSSARPPRAARAARAPRPARAAVPALPTLDSLDDTHRQMLTVLDDLTALLDHLERDGVDAQARASARAVCSFFDRHARQHHADEEAVVFPALLKREDPTLTQHVLRLQQDHGWLEEDWLELEPQLKAVAEGYSWYEIETLRHAVGIFTNLYRDHIALEESLIYPAARSAAAPPRTPDA